MYDETKAQRAIDFISCLRHTKGKQFKGKLWQWIDWQDQLVRRLFGTVDETGNRIYRKCYVEIPKKNGKSELAAAIALYLLCADEEPGAEVYSAAGDRNQASIVFNIAAYMVAQEPILDERLRVLHSTKRILYPALNSYYHVLSADDYTKHGYNIHGCVFDELHIQPNRKLWDVLNDGAGDAREQPLMFAITTAGYDRESICWEVREYAKKVERDPSVDPHFLPVIYSLDEDKDWRDEKNWYAVNPSLDKTIVIDRLRDAFKEVEYVPAKQNTFRRLRLNQWTSQDERWLPMDFWDKCDVAVDPESLKLKSCWCGLDLASCTDIAAFAKVFLGEDGFYDVVMRFWIPEDNMQERCKRDRVPYDVWVREGYIKATPGNYIDHKTVEKDILEDAETHHIQELAFDRWGMEYMSQNMIAGGIEAFPFGQGYKSLSPPTKELLKLVLSQKLRHGGNPVLRWMADNLVVETDAAESVKPNKKKSRERIDGMVALIMGLDRAIKQNKDRAEVEVWAV